MSPPDCSCGHPANEHVDISPPDMCYTCGCPRYRRPGETLNLPASGPPVPRSSRGSTMISDPERRPYRRGRRRRR